MLTPDQVQRFQADGYCILEDVITPVDAQAIIETADRLAAALLARLPALPPEPQGAEAFAGCRFLQLVQASRPDAGRVFDALVKIPLVNRLLYAERLQRIAEQLLASSLVLAPPTQMNLRADHPDEGRFLYPWHTDYSYNSSSANSLVFWIPLQDVDLVNGALHIIPGSHKVPARVRYDEAAIARKMSSAYFEIENIDELLRQGQDLRCPLRLGQAVVFHAHLVHKSGVNASGRTRFALQSRWFDALAPDAAQARFVGGLDEGVHPRSYLPA